MRGHIRKRGKKWCIVVDLGKVGNKRRQKWFSGYNRRKDAEADLVRVINELKSGAFIEASKLTLSEYLDTWMAYNEEKLEYQSKSMYKSFIETRVRPWLGDMILQKIEPIHIKDFYQKMVSAGRMGNKEGKLSPATMQFYRTVLKSIFASAKEDGLINDNIVKNVRLPVMTKNTKSQARKNVKVMNEQQVKILEAKAQEVQYSNGTFYPLIFVAVRTGCRRNELLALTWDDIDFENKVIHVCKSLVVLPEGKCEYKAPKTDYGIRDIPVSEDVIKVLRRHRAKQSEYKMLVKKTFTKAGKEYNPDNLIFCSPYGKFIPPQEASTFFKKIVIDMNLPDLTFHCLRHTHASLLLKAGVDIKIISERLGHSSVSMTYDLYSHLFPQQKESAVAKLDSLLKNE